MFASFSDVVNELEEAEIDWQLFLRNAAMGAPPRAERRGDVGTDSEVDDAEPLVLSLAADFPVFECAMAPEPLTAREVKTHCEDCK